MALGAAWMLASSSIESFADRDGAIRAARVFEFENAVAHVRPGLTWLHESENGAGVVQDLDHHAVAAGRYCLIAIRDRDLFSLFAGIRAVEGGRRGASHDRIDRRGFAVGAGVLNAGSDLRRDDRGIA